MARAYSVDCRECIHSHICVWHIGVLNLLNRGVGFSFHGYLKSGFGDALFNVVAKYCSLFAKRES